MHCRHHFAQVNWEGVAFVRHKTESVSEGHFVQNITVLFQYVVISLLYSSLMVSTKTNIQTNRRILRTKSNCPVLMCRKAVTHKGYALPINLSKMMMTVHQIQPLMATNFLNGVLVSYKLSLDALIARGEIKTQSQRK